MFFLIDQRGVISGPRGFVHKQACYFAAGLPINFFLLGRASFGSPQSASD